MHSSVSCGKYFCRIWVLAHHEKIDIFEFKRYLAMDLNEKLQAAGLYEQYEEALQEKDSLKIQTILKQLGLDDQEIRNILEDLDTDPPA